MPASAPVPSSSSSTCGVERRRAAPRRGARPRPTPRCRSSTSRRAPITPPAPQPTSAAGDSASWTASSTASGAARCAPEANTTARSHARPPSPLARGRAPPRGRPRAGRGWWTGRRRCGRACRNDDTPRVLLRRSPSSGPPAWARPRWRVALAERLRAGGEDPVAVSADALQVYRGLETLTGAATAADASALEHRLLGVPAVTAAFSAGAYARLAHAEIDALLAARPPPDRRRRHRPLPARRARRARPAPARSPGDPRERRRAELDERGAARAARRARGPRAPQAAAAIRPTDAPARHPRARAARRRPRAARGRAAVDRRHAPPDAARRPDDGARGARTRGSTRASTRWSPPVPSDEVRAADAAGASRHRAQGARLPASCSPATSRR